MKKNSYLYRLFFVVAISVLSTAEAAPSYLALDTGYRYDQVTIAHNRTAPTLAFASNLAQNRNLQSYQLGFRALWQPSCICNHLVVKGAAHYSWILSGRAVHDQGVDRGRARGHFVDASAGLGYAFCACDCFEFVPYIGGSYDKQRLKNDRLFFSPTLEEDPTIVNYNISYYGPWAGFDFYFNTTRCCVPLFFDVGYEFHYGWICYKRDDEVFEFHQRGTIPNSKGHVFHLGVSYPFCGNWLIGARVQYTFWQNAHQKTLSVDPVQVRRHRITELRWQSFSATLDLGFAF